MLTSISEEKKVKQALRRNNNLISTVCFMFGMLMIIRLQTDFILNRKEVQFK